MTGRGEKLQQLHCYHPFSDSLDMYLTKNHYENYSPQMVPIAKIWGSGSWTIVCNIPLYCHVFSPLIIKCAENYFVVVLHLLSKSFVMVQVCFLFDTCFLNFDS